MTTSNVDPIVIKGSHFFNSNGTQFYLSGVRYGSWSRDFLADSQGCSRDITALTSLGINTIFVYGIDSTQSHATCIGIFMENNIYMLVGLGTHSEDAEQQPSQTWTNDKFASYVEIIDEFAQYTNTLGFNVVFDDIEDITSVAPQAKAAVRDVKGYIEAEHYRSIPVGGYASTYFDIYNVTTQYMACGNQSDIPDFWSLENLNWCMYSNSTSEFYSDLTGDFSSYGIPIFLAGYGCDDIKPFKTFPGPGTFNETLRTFREVPALYGSNMTEIWSGGIVYTWLEDSDNPEYGYSIPPGNGLVYLDNNTLQLRPDYKVYSSQLARINPSITQISAYTPTPRSPVACPTQNASGIWAASPILPPNVNYQLCSCMVASLYCVMNPDSPSNTLSSVHDSLCSQNSTICDGLLSNGTTATYGAFSICSSWQQVSWVLNQNYLNHGKESSECLLTTEAELRTPPSLNSSCKDLLSQAGPLGTTPIYSGITADSLMITGDATGNSKRLSKGAIAGIAVGGALLAMIIACLIFWRVRKVKQRKALLGDGLKVAPPWTGQEAPTELPIREHKAELPTQEKKAELPTQENRAELYAPNASSNPVTVESREHDDDSPSPLLPSPQTTEISELP